MDTAAAVGGSGTLSIELARDCAWTASSGAAWVVITSASNGQGGAMIAYRVGVNAGPQRTGSLSLLGDQIFWVIQNPSRRPVLKDFLAL
jgi:phage tail sheath gpL-like